MATPTPELTATPRRPAATPSPTGEPSRASTPIGRPRDLPTLTPEATTDPRKRALLTFLNQFQVVDSLWIASVLVHVPRLQQGISMLVQNREQGVSLITSAIAAMVNDLERLLPLMKGLVPPPELSAYYGQYVQGAELFLDGLKRIDRGLVENNVQLFNAGLADYARGDGEMRAAREGLKAVAGQYGISYDEQTHLWK